MPQLTYTQSLSVYRRGYDRSETDYNQSRVPKSKTTIHKV